MCGNGVWSLTHPPDAVLPSPAEIGAGWPMTVTRSGWRGAFARRTQKPFSLLWKVTRSTKPASTSWVDGSCCGLICVATVGASPPNRVWRPALRSRSSPATRAPRVLSIGDRPLVGNRPAIQILGSLEAACDDGAVAAVELLTLGRPADSFGLSERCLLGGGIFLMSPRLVRVQAEVPIRTSRRAEARSERSRRWQRRGSIGLRGGQPVRTIPSPPSSGRAQTSASLFAFIALEWGLFALLC